ncbi:MAG: hypothetical protein ED859_11620 [Desulfuromonadales bacterium]|nr:MAG: hypothetical protein ED859_11620 [Desulfuromonadales bacterium]
MNKVLTSGSTRKQLVMASFLILVVLVLVQVRPASSQENDLFIPVRERAAELPPEQQSILDRIKQEKTTSQVNIVRINPSSLERDQVNLNLFDNATFKTRKGVTTRRDEKGMTWTGDLTDSKGDATFVVRGDSVTGTVRSDTGFYQIRPLGSGLHAVIEIDQSKLPKEHPPSFNRIEKQKKTIPPAMMKKMRDAGVARDTKATVEVLVAYTPLVKAATADVDGLIQLAIDETNKGYQNSGINAQLHLAHSYEVNDQETVPQNADPFDAILTRFREPGDGKMDEIHALRKQYAADVAVLLISRDEYCGLASDIMAKASNAFAVVSNQCATGYYSFGHEIGHLMGARHDPANDNTSTPFAYGHGYQNLAGKWRTVMAYNCPGGCTRVNNWSNPSVKYGGAPTGTVSLNDNARVLNQTTPIVAAFYPATPSIDLSKFKNMKKLCQIVGCNGPFKPWQELVNPSPTFQAAIGAGGSKAAKLGDIKTKAINLSSQMENSDKAGQVQIEKKAYNQLRRLKALNVK